MPRYAAIYKQNNAKSPLAGLYSQNPYVNGVIAAKAAFAAQNSVSFESNAFTGETPLTTVELCVLISEMLTRACGEAAAYEGERRVRFTAQPGENSLTMEAVYSGQLPQKETFSLKGKTLSRCWVAVDETPARTTSTAWKTPGHCRALQRQPLPVRRAGGSDSAHVPALLNIPISAGLPPVFHPKPNTKGT